MIKQKSLQNVFAQEYSYYKYDWEIDKFTPPSAKHGYSQSSKFTYFLSKGNSTLGRTIN
jgi:hypothetical protein